MTEVPVPPAPEAAEKVNPWQRLVGVFITPTSTFASIVRRPDVLVPLLVLLVISVVLGVTVAQKVDFNALARASMEGMTQTAKMPADQLERMLRFTAAFMKIATYASPFFSLLILLISAGVLLMGFRLMGGEGDFKQAFSITTYAWYPRIAKGVLATIVLISKKNLSMFDLQDPLRSNPAFLFDPRTQPVQFALATSLDVFAIWTIVLLIIGFSLMSRLSRGKAAVIVISLWIVAILFGLIGPALQAMRSDS